MKKRNIAILLSIGAFFIFAATFLISYGFVSSKIFGNERDANTFINQIIKVEYSDGTEVLTTKQGSDFIPGSTIEKTFTIKNLSNKDVSYAVRLDDVVNSFERKKDLVYELYLNDKLLTKNIFPSTDGSLAYNIYLKKDASQNFKLKINYLKSMENQIVDSGSTISGSLNFEERQSSLSNIIIYGDSIQNDMPTKENPMNVQSVGDYVSDTNNEYFGKYKITLNYNENSNYDIYLNEPLRCIENNCDYIDLKNSRVIRLVKEINLKDLANPEMANDKITINLRDYNVLPNSSILNNYSTIDNIKIVDETLELTNLSSYWGINNINDYNNFIANNDCLIHYLLNTKEIEEVDLPSISDIDSGSDITVATTLEPQNIKLEYK